MDKFPQVIKDVPHWALCGFTGNGASPKQPYVWNNNTGMPEALRKDGNHQGPSNLHLLMDFQNASACQRYYHSIGINLDLGFYIMPTDPFCCIDMDVKPEWSDEEKERAGVRYTNIVRTFNSYTEVSRSGLGLHLWVYGQPQEGKRRDNVEMYSQYRFMICTGNHWNITPLEVMGAPGTEHESRIYELVQMMRADMKDLKKMGDFQMVELTREQFDDDAYAKSTMQIYEMASTATNAALFLQLIDGRYQPGEVNYEMGERAFPSASEAEYALIDILAFYTPYNFQVREMFMYTPFGDRYDSKRRKPGQKIKRPVHLEYMIKKYRFDEFMKDKSQAETQRSNVQMALENLERQRQAAMPAPAPVEFKSTDGNFTEEAHGGLEWPPGFVGEIARHMFQSSLRPIKDISILSAVTMLSGIVGKGWNTHTMGGLNNYFVLVARSGIGKDAFKDNIEKLLRTVEMFGGPNGGVLVGARQFLDSSKYSSEPALIKATLAQDISNDSEPGTGNGRLSFTHYMGEISEFIQDMAGGRNKAPEIAHRMLMLYNGSYFHARDDGVKYSNKENNHNGGRIAAYTAAGEATPEKFYAAISGQMLSDGFMSRWIVWNCDVPRPLENQNCHISVPEFIVRGVGDLCIEAIKLHGGVQPRTVMLNPDVLDEYNRLDVEIRDLLNGKDGEGEEQDEVIRQIHNRRAFKILKVACVLAVAENMLNPVVNMTQYLWAKNFVDTGAGRLLEKYKEGELGAGTDNSRLRKLLKRCLYLLKGGNGRDTVAYPEMKADYILTKSDLSINVKNAAAFNGPRGSAYYFDLAISELIQHGGITPMSAAELAAKSYSNSKGHIFRGVAFKMNWSRLEELDSSLN